MKRRFYSQHVLSWVCYLCLVFPTGTRNLSAAESRPNTAPEGYSVQDGVISATGQPFQLQDIPADVLHVALNMELEVRFKHVRIIGDLQPPYEVKQAFTFIGCQTGENFSLQGSRFHTVADFTGTKFGGDLDLRDAAFARIADFRNTNIAGRARFRDATFQNGAYFRYTTFQDTANFQGAAFFRNWADFTEVTFGGYANYNGTQFHSGASFSDANFSTAGAFFRVAKFLDIAMFGGAVFPGFVSLANIRFMGEVEFTGTKFNAGVDFAQCRFKEPSKFTSAVYGSPGARFQEVTGFSEMEIDWFGDVGKGLRHKLDYDETFYIALIKNYQEMGWFDEADDAYYTYRSERRKHLGSDFARYAELIFLEIPFGYGVKPLMLGRTFLIIWFVFAWVYVACLTHWVSGRSPWNHPQFTLSEMNGFVWGFLHSLNVLTPGIDLHSLGSSFLQTGSYSFDVQDRWVMRIQRVQQLLGWYLLALLLTTFGKVWVR